MMILFKNRIKFVGWQRSLRSLLGATPVARNIAGMAQRQGFGEAGHGYSELELGHSEIEFVYSEIELEVPSKSNSGKESAVSKQVVLSQLWRDLYSKSTITSKHRRVEILNATQIQVQIPFPETKLSRKSHLYFQDSITFQPHRRGVKSLGVRGRNQYLQE